MANKQKQISYQNFEHLIANRIQIKQNQCRIKLRNIRINLFKIIRKILLPLIQVKFKIQQKYQLLTMRVINCLHKMLASMDFFPVHQFLRYKGSSQYKTATGGFFSILIIIIFMILFIDSGIHVFKKQKVYLTTDTHHKSSPSSSKLVTNANGKFMFAINVANIGVFDDNHTNFNVSLKKTYTERGKGTIITNTPMEKCSHSHFSFDPQILQQYDKFDFNHWLCPPLDYQFTIEGTIISDIFQQFSLYIKKCDPISHNNCAPQSKINNFLSAYGYFQAVITIVTVQLNPSFSQNYIKIHGQGRNGFPFSTTFGIKANAEIQDYQIITDVSLLPVANTVFQKGSYIPHLIEHNTVPVFDDTYVTINFRKSTKSVTYTRNYEKIEDFLSYIGGLVGIIFSLVFILTNYSELCFQISLASRLFKYKENKNIDSSSFNILVYIVYFFYKICRFFDCCQKFPMMEIYNECHEQMEKQIDIQIILQRISKLQLGLMTLINPKDFDQIFFYQNFTLEQAKTLRKKMNILKKYEKKAAQITKIEQQYPKSVFNCSEQSSFSSMKTQQYQKFKNQLKILQTPNKNFENFFSNRLAKKNKQKLGKKQKKFNQIQGNNIEEYRYNSQLKYFREMENQYISHSINKPSWSSALQNKKHGQL